MAIKEMHQHHDMEEFHPRYANELTSGQQKDALSLLMYLKERRNGKEHGVIMCRWLAST